MDKLGPGSGTGLRSTTALPVGVLVWSGFGSVLGAPHPWFSILADDRLNDEGGARSFAQDRPARIFRRGPPSPKMQAS